MKAEYLNEKRPEKIYNFIIAKIGWNTRNGHDTGCIIRILLNDPYYQVK
jgi:hypothetical protein